MPNWEETLWEEALWQTLKRLSLSASERIGKGGGAEGILGLLIKGADPVTPTSHMRKITDGCRFYGSSTGFNIILVRSSKNGINESFRFSSSWTFSNSLSPQLLSCSNIWSVICFYLCFGQWQVNEIKERLEESKRFWSKLPDDICSEELTQPDEEQCWNSHTKGRWELDNCSKSNSALLLSHFPCQVLK